MYTLRVTGQYYKPDGSPEATMADMLRYDDGELVDWKPIPIAGLRVYEGFVAEVHTNRFTPDRWKSFGLKAEMRRKEPGKASCRFNSPEDVQRFIQKRKGGV